MEKFHADVKDDITQESYQGPGKVITSAGYMYVSHLFAVIGGFAILGAIGALAHSQTNKIKQWAQNLSESHAESSGIKKGFAGAVAFVSENAEIAAHKIVGWGKKITRNRFSGSSRLGEEKTAAFLFAGGFGAIFGYFGSSFWGIVKGSHEGGAGKRQFERAKAEIHALQEKNQDLEKINEKLRAEYVEASTRKPAANSDEKSPTDVTSDISDAKTTQNAAPETTLQAAQHDGKLQSERVAAPEVA